MEGMGPVITLRTMACCRSRGRRGGRGQYALGSLESDGGSDSDDDYGAGTRAGDDDPVVRAAHRAAMRASGRGGCGGCRGLGRCLGCATSVICCPVKQLCMALLLPLLCIGVVGAIIAGFVLVPSYSAVDAAEQAATRAAEFLRVTAEEWRARAAASLWGAGGAGDGNATLVAYRTLAPSDDWPALDRLVVGVVRLVSSPEGAGAPPDAPPQLEWNLTLQRPVFAADQAPPNARLVLVARSVDGDEVYHLAARDQLAGSLNCRAAQALCAALRMPDARVFAALHVVLLDRWPWPAPEVPRDANASAARYAVGEAAGLALLPAHGRLVASRV